MIVSTACRGCPCGRRPQFTAGSAPAAFAVSVPAPVATTASVETPAVYDDEAGGDADADDPAVWVDPAGPARSIVIGTLKNAGLDVYGLNGQRLQHIAAPAAPSADAEPGRFNNVDVVYGFDLGGQTTDLALVSDRGRDRIRIYAIDPKAVSEGRPPLTDVTAAGVAPVSSAAETAVDEQRSAYGLAAYVEDGNVYVVVSRRSETRLKAEADREQRQGRLCHRGHHRHARLLHAAQRPALDVVRRPGRRCAVRAWP